MPTEEGEESPRESIPEKFDGGNVIMHCVLHEDKERFAKVFDDAENPDYESASVLLKQRSEVGKSPIEVACMLGRADILKDIIKRGCDVNAANGSGYCPIHFAAAWGHVKCLEALVESGASVDCTTRHGELAKEIAFRYDHNHCVYYLNWAAAKLALVAFISHARELIADPEKLQGMKLTKEEKTTILGSCSEKQEWLENTTDATADDFIAKKTELEKQIDVILNKTISPAPTTENGKK
ncbi:ankyrin repeat domain-containing protein 45-like isoform X1 [Ciona intestinalis]